MVGNRDYSGFNRDEWGQKTNEQYLQTVARLGACKAKAERSKIESQTGFRNTALLKLPYFNPSRMLVIDPMHNLFLGTAKHI